MKTFLLATLFAAVSLTARPPVESFPSLEASHVIIAYNHANHFVPRPVRTTAAELFTGNQAGDCIFWDTYTGQPIAKGDLVMYISSQTKLPIWREIASVNPLKTTRGFAVPLDKMRGIARRIIRVTP